MRIFEFMDTMERILQLENLRETVDWNETLEEEWTRLRDIKIKIVGPEEEVDE